MKFIQCHKTKSEDPTNFDHLKSIIIGERHKIATDKFKNINIRPK